MSFNAIRKSFGLDKSLSPRAALMIALRRVLDGTQYDDLRFDFHDEKDSTEKYIPIRQRRPAARYPLCRLLVDDSVSLLFGGDHTPTVECEDEATQDTLQAIAKDCRVQEVLIEAATKGSVGSIVLHLRILLGVVYVSVMNTEFLTPTWNPEAPDELVKVTELRKVKGIELREAGYTVADDHLQVMHWFQRTWDAATETWFVPWVVGSKPKDYQPQIDAARTVAHALGFLPMVWVRNLPGGNAPDGLPTFTPETIDTQVEIEYLLSQGGRGLKYASDPLLLIKEPAGDGGSDIVRSASNAVIVDKDGDAKLVEISGSAAQTIIEWARFLRELALEGAHGNRASAEKLSAAQSGKAMELMNQALIWLVERLRITYGEIGLLSLMRMIVLASTKMQLKTRDDSDIAPMSAKATLTLRWPAWYKPTGQDLLNLANTMRTLVDSGVMSRETAVNVIAAQFDIEDVQAELAMVKAEEAARQALVQPANVQEKIKVVE